MIFINLKLSKPIFLKIISSLFSINCRKKNCEEIKNINGKISYKIDGAFNKFRSKGKNKLTSIF